MTAFELAVQDPAGIGVAARVGADRIELCSALSLGGLTPSAALIETAVAVQRAGGPEVHVLVRPRGGDFEYGDDERALIERDTRWAVEAGAAGVVIGGLVDGAVDARLVARLRDVAGDASVTFHRAFDTMEDRGEALEVLAGLGVRRILTSGAASAAPDGLDELARLVALADGRIEIMAGAGIRSDNVETILMCGVDAVHASAKRSARQHARIALGTDSPAGETVIDVTDEVEAARLVAIVRGGATAVL